MASSIPFPDEVLHLAKTNEQLEAALQKAGFTLSRIDQEYREAKNYMVQYRGEIDPHEMFQNELALKQIDYSGAFAAGNYERLRKLQDSPYFARIDFGRDSGQTAAHYIGRFTFSLGNKLLIFDWRAPISSMFYDCETGPAEYDAPAGRVKGILTRKRQFKIKDGVLEYALENAVHIQDDVLLRELSLTSDDKMKSIIATIQKEQNQIIRNEQAGTMLIQGVAGSGKTSIALHRIAFLLYRQKDRLSAKNITILSPNKVFGDYISNVLPELGEEPIYEMGFSDLVEIQLEKGISFEPDKNPLETSDEKWAKRVRFKSTLDFVKQMEKYIGQLPALVFKAADFSFGCFTAETGWIQARFNAYKNYPIKKRLLMTAYDVYEQFDSVNIMEDELPKRGTIKKSLNAMLTIKNTLALYKEFYRQIGHSDMFVMPDKKTLEWNDVFPFLYLFDAFEGLHESKIIKHLVIDEMQDYTPIQYAVLNRLFPCQKTILGDFGQLINPNHLHTLDDLRQLYKDAMLLKLNKSYRSTFEIIAFANKIQSDSALEPVSRHGKAPSLIPCRQKSEEILRIKEEISSYSQNGYTSLGIITKTNRDAKALYSQLSNHAPIQLISPDSTHFEGGISITSVQLSKGLEFDAVLIPDADSLTYQNEYDRSLLYIACTRAMHRLTLLFTGEISPFIL